MNHLGSCVRHLVIIKVLRGLSVYECFVLICLTECLMYNDVVTGCQICQENPFQIHISADIKRPIFYITANSNGAERERERAI